MRLKDAYQKLCRIEVATANAVVRARLFYRLSVDSPCFFISVEKLDLCIPTC